MRLSQKQNSFSQVFGAFLKTISNFKHRPKNMTLLPHLFQKSEIAKEMVR